ncbi:MAG: DUF2786 domain-containing protein [Hyphomicrobiales bacterium]
MNDSRKKMLERVRAIMAKTMTNGCTEGEAMAALAKAQELMATYDISEADLGHTVETESATIHKCDVNDPYQIKRYLSAGVAKFTRCRSWRGRSYGVAFCGLESDVAFATWLLDTLQGFVMRALKEHQAERKAKGLSNPRIISSSFVLAFATRIYQRLSELAPKEPLATAGNALVVSRNALITEAMAKAGISLKKARNTSRRVDGSAWSAGEAAGNSARFDRPVASGGSRLLAYPVDTYKHLS